MSALPLPDPDGAPAWVDAHLGHLRGDGPGGARRSGTHRGGQAAADAALAAFDVTGYASRRNQVLPPAARGASMLSPWIRHGLLPLREVWDHVGGGPPGDVAKFRDELLWQEYARHVHARLGGRLAAPLRAAPEVDDAGPDPWDDSAPGGGALPCVGEALRELRDDGWVVNQARMWLASQWTVRGHRRWQDGEDEMFRHLLDGSRAANRLGWQWTTGAGSAKPYGFSRWQVERRAPALCAGCAHRRACPIEATPGVDLAAVPEPAALRQDPDPAATAGPASPELDGAPDAVWVTAESLGTRDPALAAHPDLPVVFCFDEPLLARLRLSGPRLVFLAECLAGLAAERDLTVHLGPPAEVLRGGRWATTVAPVPGHRRLLTRLGADVVARHPWPWLVRPHGGPVRSFSAWRKRAGTP